MMYREGKVFGLISGSDLPGPVSIGLRRGRLTGVCTFRAFRERMNVAEPAIDAPRSRNFGSSVVLVKVFRPIQSS